jgi:hypothetical protein
MYKTLKFLALQGAPHIYDISRLRVKSTTFWDVTLCSMVLFHSNLLPPSSWNRTSYIYPEESGNRFLQDSDNYVSELKF